MMRLMYWELRKILIKQHGIMVLLFYFVAYVLVTSVSIQAGNVISSSIQSQLNEYYVTYSGLITDKEMEDINALKESIEAASEERVNAYISYEQGRISFEELTAKLKMVVPFTRQETAFMRFYADFKYCVANPEQRFILDTRGWEKLLSNDSPQLFLLFTALLLSSMIFKEDCDKEMQLIIKPTMNGHNRILWIKIGASFVTMLLIWIVSVVAEVLSVALVYPLASSNAPLQSLETFCNHSTGMSISEGFWIGYLIRLLGLWEASILALCLTASLRSPMLGCFLPFAVCVLGYFALDYANQYIMFPLPLSFLNGHLFLIAQEGLLTLRTFMTILIGAIILSLCVLCVGVFCYRDICFNRSQKL